MTRRDERGSAAIEAAIGVPAFALFVGLIIFGGRTASTHEALQSAAADGARSASLARDAQTARDRRSRGCRREHRQPEDRLLGRRRHRRHHRLQQATGRTRLGRRHRRLPPRPLRPGSARRPRLARHARDHVQPDRHLAGTMRRQHDERGSITVWLALSSFVMIFLVGLAVDLGGQVHAHERAHDLAAQAARAGGEEVEGGAAIQGRELDHQPRRGPSGSPALPRRRRRQRDGRDHQRRHHHRDRPRLVRPAVPGPDRHQSSRRHRHGDSPPDPHPRR